MRSVYWRVIWLKFWRTVLAALLACKQKHIWNIAHAAANALLSSWGIVNRDWLLHYVFQQPSWILHSGRLWGTGMTHSIAVQNVIKEKEFCLIEFIFRTPGSTPTRAVIHWSRARSATRGIFLYFICFFFPFYTASPNCQNYKQQYHGSLQAVQQPQVCQLLRGGWQNDLPPRPSIQAGNYLLKLVMRPSTLCTPNQARNSAAAY